MGERSGSNTAGYIESIILSGASEGNVLPLTSCCNLNCLFCSHRQNPPGAEVLRIAPRSMKEIEATISFLDPGRPVVIGESATRIIEGEPFTHPEIVEVLRLVRAAFPNTIIQITTNGSLLDEKKLEFLSRLGKIEICFSLNSCSETGRALLMGDSEPGRAVKSTGMMQEYGLPFHGSIVAMPHVVGWPDLENTVKHLCTCGARTVRVFLPGFTTISVPALRFKDNLWEQLNTFISRLRKETNVPLTCEPPLITDLRPEVTGVMAASPASNTGLRPGDVIEAVNGRPVLTRVHAFNLILEAGIVELVVVRNENEKVILKIDKKPGGKSGLVMDYDLDPRLLWEVNRIAQKYGSLKVLLLTSELAYPVINMALRKFCGENVEALTVKNNYFGGSIKCAGLLTVDDFRVALEKYFYANPAPKPALIMLPGRAFDLRGRDIKGVFYGELQEIFATCFEII